jgi:hypothetical protein
VDSCGELFIMWGFKGNEEKDEDIRMAAADIKLFISKISNAKKRRFWVRPKLSKRKIVTHMSLPYYKTQNELYTLYGELDVVKVTKIGRDSSLECKNWILAKKLTLLKPEIT